MVEARTSAFGQTFEVNLSDVLRERFSSGQGVLQLQPDMTDGMLLLIIKNAISFSDGKAFVVIPPAKMTSHTNGTAATLHDASLEELAALREFAQWAEKHAAVLREGRRHGIRFGVTPKVADYLRASGSTPGVGEALAANLVPIREDLHAQLHTLHTALEKIWDSGHPDAPEHMPELRGISEAAFSDRLMAIAGEALGRR